MRKKILLILLLVFSVFFIGPKVDAATKCAKEAELKAEANMVEVNYELVKPEKGDNGDFDPTVYYYDVIITNVSDNFVIGVGDNTYLSSLAKDGKLTIRMVGGGYKIRVVIYSSKKTGCEDVKLRSIPVELPHYNRFSDYEECVGHTNEYPICAPNANTNKYGYDDDFEKEFKKQAEEYENNKNKKKKNDNNGNGNKNILELYMDNAGITIPVTILIVIAIIGLIYKKVSDDKKKIKIDLGERKHEKKNK